LAKSKGPGFDALPRNGIVYLLYEELLEEARYAGVTFPELDEQSTIRSSKTEGQVPMCQLGTAN
jgi:hypothetical protein